MIDETKLLRDLHQAYVNGSGLVVEFTMSRIHAWQLWRSRGWGFADLGLVLKYLKRMIKEGKKWQSSLGFRALIENTDAFEELLAMARAQARQPKVDRAKAEVLRATGRKEEVKAQPRSAAEILRDAKAFEDFRAFARSL